MSIYFKMNIKDRQDRRSHKATTVKFSETEWQMLEPIRETTGITNFLRRALVEQAKREGIYLNA